MATTVPTIKELDWRPHRVGMGGEQAIINFPNGYGASCLRGGMFYTKGGTYEIGVLHNGKLTYKTHITSDVLGYLPEEEANKVLRQIAALPADTSAN
jgi:hypothetical protein